MNWIQLAPVLVLEVGSSDDGNELLCSIKELGISEYLSSRRLIKEECVLYL